jgi:cell division protein FtsW
MRAGNALVLIVVSLLVIGVVMVRSAGLEIAGEPVTMIDAGLVRTSLVAALAVAMMFLASRINVARLGALRGAASPAVWIVAVCGALLLLVHVPGVGREINGARRWVEFGPVGFQPSELAKWGLPLAIAWYATRRAESMDRFGAGFALPMAIVGGMCALIATEDLGTATLIALVAVALLVAGGVRLWQVGLLVPVALAGFTAAVIASPYRIDRLRAFLDPYRDPEGIGYHVIQSMAAVSGGGLAGRGLGNGLQKFGYLPEDTTDFIFAVICEELGLVGAIVVIVLYAALVICGFGIVRRARTSFERLLALGIVLTIGMQALINLLVVTGLAPTKGIALPLLSWGGTGWCLTAASVGLLIAIDRGTTQECSSASLGEWSAGAIGPQVA